MYRSLLIFFFLSFFVGESKISAQRNYRIENYGNRSILLNGNVTGSVEDLGLTYYNPSRLSLVENTAFSINAKTYQYDKLALENLIEEKNSLSSSKFSGVPSMVAGTFELGKLKDHKFAYALLTKRKSKTGFNFNSKVLEGDLLIGEDEVDKYSKKFKITNEIDDEWFGLSWSKLIFENFSVGASSFLSLYSYEGTNIIKYATLDSNLDVAVFDSEVGFKQKSYGLFFKLGASYRHEKFDIGLNVTLPYLEFYDKGKLNYSRILNGLDDFDDKFIVAKYNSLDATRKEPLSIAIGAGIPIHKSKIHLNLEWYDGISKYEIIDIPTFMGETGETVSLSFDEKLNSIVNFGFGAEIYLKEKLNIFLSYSSDFSPTDKNASIFDVINNEEDEISYAANLNHYGFGIDIEFDWAKLVLGTTYTSGKSNFNSEEDEFPNNNFNEDFTDAMIKISSWKFIVGFDIPVFDKALDQFKSKVN